MANKMTTAELMAKRLGSAENKHVEAAANAAYWRGQADFWRDCLFAEMAAPGRTPDDDYADMRPPIPIPRIDA